MPDEFSVGHVPKFDGTNFLGWKFQMEAALRACGIYEIVDGTNVRPTAAEEERVKAWVKDNAKAMFIISRTMEYKQLESLLVCTTGKEMWDTLARIHQQNSAANKLVLMKRFHEYRMGATDSAVQHVAKVQNLAIQLRDLGEKVSDLTIMAKILSSLTSKFSVLQTAWDSVDPDRQTVEYLQERLITEESRLVTEKEESTAFSAMRISERAGSSKHKGDSKGRNEVNKRCEKKKRDVECYRCQEKGHYARDCPTRKQGKTARDESETRRSVFIVESSGSVNNSSRNSRFGKMPENVKNQWLQLDKKDIWYVDSGASRHITFRREWFTEFRPLRGTTVSVGDDGVCEVSGEGTVIIDKLVNGVWREARIENVLYVPKVRNNLFSVGVCTSRGFEVSFASEYVVLTDNNKIVATGVKQSNEIFRMFFRVKNARSAGEVNVTTTNLKLWHERLGHLNKRAICDLVNKQLIKGVSVTNEKDFFCDACQFGKAHRLPFKATEKEECTKPGEFIHSDVCGPMSETSPGGARYFVTFIDDASGFRYVYFLKHKSDVFERLKEFDRLIANKFGRSMKRLRTDNGREYVNEKIKQYLSSRGIQFEPCAPYTPEQNGKSERDNRTIVECARTMLKAKNLPTLLWAEAVNTAVYIQNRVLSSERRRTKTPYEIWTGEKPDLSHVRVFGSEAFVYVPKQFTKKFDARSKKVMFVGYEGNSSNYRLYNPETRTVTVSRNVVFNEKQNKSESSTVNSENEDLMFSTGDSIQYDEEQGQEKKQSNPEVIFEEPEREDSVEPQRMSDEPRRLRNRGSLRRPERYDQEYEINLAQYDSPASYEEAISGEDSSRWIEAIHEELKAHEKNHTWTVVPREADKKTIDSKWVFKKLRDTTGQVYRYKARLCARGFLQRQGIDYNETFSPVVRYDSLRLLLALVAQEDLELGQFDVKTAFLYGNLDEEILMEIPKGFNGKCVNNNTNVVCSLNKSLYGLKQAPRCWNKKFSSFLKRFEFTETNADKCIYTGCYENEIVYFALFVDDGLIACKSKEVVKQITALLSNEFEITKSDASCFIGLQISRDRARKSLFIHQSAYVK